MRTCFRDHLLAVSLLLVLAGCGAPGRQTSSENKSVVHLRPESVEEPKELAVTTGRTVILRAPMLPGARYQWFRNGQALSKEAGARRDYSISAIQLNDSGIYACLVLPPLDNYPQESAGKPWPSRTGPFVTETVILMAYTRTASGNIQWPGIPKPTPGPSGDCGPYSGYFVFYPPGQFGFEPAPSTRRKAYDPLTGNLCLNYVGSTCLDHHSGVNSIGVPNAPNKNMPLSSQYRFCVFFPPNTPMPTNYVIEIAGFLPPPS